ncbi:MAG TPA: hypothetical protein VF007_09065 [Stellaceae bacterium]
MGELLLPNAYRKRLLATLRPGERRFAESLLRATPSHGVGSVGSPKPDRRPMRSRGSVATNMG